MKKILILSVAFLLLSVGFGFAKDLEGVAGIALSSKVKGSYFANDDQTEYVIYTVHTQGNMQYATASFVTSIYQEDLGDVYASGDLTTSEPSFDSSAFDNFDEK